MFYSFKGELSNWAYERNRALFNGFHAYRVPVEPLVEGTTEEHVGPYVGMKTYQQLHSTYSVSRYHPSEETKIQAKEDLAEGLKEVFETQMSTDPNLVLGETFVDILAEAKQDLAIRKENKGNQYHNQRKIRNTQKFQKVQQIHKCLVEAVGDMDDKDTILACTWRDPDTSYYSRYCTPVEYSCSVTKGLMERLVSAPSSASKLAIRNATQKICQVFETFAANNFFSFSFLDREDRWESVLSDVCTEKVSPSTFWSRLVVTPALLELVSEGNFRDLLSYYLQQCFSRNYLTEAFVRVVHDADPTSHNHLQAEEFRLVAWNYYVKFTGLNPILGQNMVTIEDLKGDYESMSIRYRSMKDSLLSFMELEQFRSFLNIGRYVPVLTNLQYFKRSIINSPPKNTIDHEILYMELTHLLRPFCDYRINSIVG